VPALLGTDVLKFKTLSAVISNVSVELSPSVFGEFGKFFAPKFETVLSVVAVTLPLPTDVGMNVILISPKD
jgi:hypothetical protein